MQWEAVSLPPPLISLLATPFIIIIIAMHSGVYSGTSDKGHSE